MRSRDGVAGFWLSGEMETGRGLEEVPRKQILIVYICSAVLTDAYHGDFAMSLFKIKILNEGSGMT